MRQGVSDAHHYFFHRAIVAASFIFAYVRDPVAFLVA